MRGPGYLQILRENRSFRRLWLADVVSLGGDWFTTVALLTMLGAAGGGSTAVGAAFAARFVPQFLFAPLAGVVADRLPRRTVMIACDLIRVVVVLGFLLANGGDRVWLVYVLLFLQMALTAFFEPAAQAAAGTVVSKEHLVAANTLQGITWSLMLAVGSLAGGLVTNAFGREASFAIDAASYVLSAWLISGAIVPFAPGPAAPTTLAGALGLHDVRDGLRHLADNHRVARIVLAKAAWGVAGGGAIVLYTEYAEHLFPLGEGGALSMGVLFAGRGVGALLGPLIARRVGGDGETFLERAIRLSFLVMTSGYVALVLVPDLLSAAFVLVVTHAAISTVWVFSTSLIHLWVPQEIRGRVFSTESAAFMLAMTVSSGATGWAVDHVAGPRALVGALAVVTAATALGWWWSGRRVNGSVQ